MAPPYLTNLVSSASSKNTQCSLFSRYCCEPTRLIAVDCPPPPVPSSRSDCIEYCYYYYLSDFYLTEPPMTEREVLTECWCEWWLGRRMKPPPPLVLRF